MKISRRYLGIIFTILYGVSLLLLASVWYDSYTAFHWFDDFFEWKYIDKVGHFYASFQLGLLFYKVFGRPGELTESVQKRWLCFSGFVLLLPIEILDGFSQNYGASPADLLANGLGAFFCYAFVSFRRISAMIPKFSFHPTTWSIIRPELLGTSWSQQWLKDYNGQTYWLSLDVNQLLGMKVLPSWLSLTVGYGADGLLGGHDNVWTSPTGVIRDYSPVPRTERILVSVDLNPKSLRGKSTVLYYLLAPFELIKFPAPAIEFNFERGVIFHPLYF